MRSYPTYFWNWESELLKKKLSFLLWEVISAIWLKSPCFFRSEPQSSRGCCECVWSAGTTQTITRSTEVRYLYHVMYTTCLSRGIRYVYHVIYTTWCTLCIPRDLYHVVSYHVMYTTWSARHRLSPDQLRYVIYTTWYAPRDVYHVVHIVYHVVHIVYHVVHIIYHVVCLYHMFCKIKNSSKFFWRRALFPWKWMLRLEKK